MIKVICDRCGMTIGHDNKPLDIKFDIYKRFEESFEESERVVQLHLCADCTKDLERFFRGEAVK